MNLSDTWFDTPEKVAALRALCASFEDTPFFANSEAPGRDGGIDCVHALHYVYRTLGVVPRIEIPPQVMDWGAHSDRSKLIEAFETWPELIARFRCVWRQTEAKEPLSIDLLPGDALCFLAGHVPHHGGLAISPESFWHALKNRGWHPMQLRAAVRGWEVLGFLAAVYRPLPVAP